MSSISTPIRVALAFLLVFASLSLQSQNSFRPLVEYQSYIENYDFRPLIPDWEGFDFVKLAYASEEEEDILIDIRNDDENVIILTVTDRFGEVLLKKSANLNSTDEVKAKKAIERLLNKLDTEGEIKRIIRSWYDENFEKQFVKYLTSGVRIHSPEGVWYDSKGERHYIFDATTKNDIFRTCIWVRSTGDRLVQRGRLEVLKDNLVQYYPGTEKSAKGVMIGLDSPDMFRLLEEFYSSKAFSSSYSKREISYIRVIPGDDKNINVRSDDDSMASGSGAESIENALSSGTGFLVSTTGFFATNYHVIEDNEKIKVILDSKEYDAIVVKTDQSNDLALLQLIGFHSLSSLPYSINQDYRAGQEVFTMGYPKSTVMGKEVKYSSGELNSLSGIEDNSSMMQISVPLQPGNSGGPLFDANGDVIGITSMTLDPLESLINSGTLPQNVNYAVKADYLLTLLKGYDLGEVGQVEWNEVPDMVEGYKPFVGLILIY